MKFRLPESFNFRKLFSKFPRSNRSNGMKSEGRFSLSFQRLHPARSTGVRLFLYFFVVIVIAVASVGWISYSTSESIIRDQVSESKLLTTIQTVQTLELVLQRYDAASLEIILLPELRDMVLQHRVNPDNETENAWIRSELKKRLDTYSYSDTNILGVHLIPINEGMPLVSSTGITKDQVEGQEWIPKVVELDGKGLWLETSLRGPSGSQMRPSFGYARAIRDEITYQTNYVLLIEIRESRFQGIAAGSLGEGSLMYIVNGSGTILSSPNDEDITQPLNIPLNGSASDGAVNIEPFNGQDMLVTHRNVGETGWQLVGVQPFAPLIAEARKILDITLIMIAVSAIAAILIGWMMAARIGGPLRSLGQLMKKAEGGDLSVQAPFAKRSDEIGTVAKGFNEMMSNIRALVQESHQSVNDVMNTAKELSEASQRTATSAKEIALATEQIALGASSVAVEAEKVTDVTNTMGDRMKQTIQANQEMVGAAGEIRASSQQGTEYMSSLSEKTSGTEKLTLSMVNKVEELKQSTASIRDILDVLNQLTKQTNILSLNATIEAARAGEAGRGFMVVADEIRKLADQSKQSIATVGQITERIRKEIEETVHLMGQAYPMFQEQITSVKEANQIFESVNESMSGFVTQLNHVSESVKGLEQVQRTLAEAMSSVSAVAEQSSATSEEVAGLTSDQQQVGESLVGLASRLEDVSQRLRDTLNKFRM